MVKPTMVVLALLAGVPAASAQSLFIAEGERAAEGSVAWSVGPSSSGVEAHGAVSLHGRWDVGLGLNHYSFDVPGGGDQAFTEWAPFVRYFLFKEQDDAVPVSLALHGQYFHDDYDVDGSGWYALVGATMAKRLGMGDGFALYPFVGFSLGTESFTFGAADPARETYLTRQFGVHGLAALADGLWLRVTVDEQAFRRETYRAVRVAVVGRF